MKITFKNDIFVAMDFVLTCNHFVSPIDLCVNNHYIVDAKSNLGVCAFVGENDLNVEIHTNSKDEKERFEESMKKFAIS